MYGVNLTKDQLDSIKRMDFLFKDIINFNSVTDEDLESIKQKAENIRNIFEKEKEDRNYYAKIISYVIYYKSGKEERLTNEKRVILLLELIDPEHNLYKIYEQYSNYNRIKQIMRMVYGFYTKNIFRVERLYIQRFENLEDYLFDDGFYLGLKNED